MIVLLLCVLHTPSNVLLMLSIMLNAIIMPPNYASIFRHNINYTGTLLSFKLASLQCYALPLTYFCPILCQKCICSSFVENSLR